MSVKKIPVLVTTKHRGVFFGYCLKEDIEKEILSLENARLCLYWSSDVRGFMGLAATGPTASCRIGPRCPGISLREITAVLDCSPDAVLKWEAAPWG